MPPSICLAVSPSLRALGVPGRARLFEVIQRVRDVNRERLYLTGYEAVLREANQRTEEEVERAQGREELPEIAE